MLLPSALSRLPQLRRLAATHAPRLHGAFVNLAYPPACIACGAASAEAEALCPRCWGQIRFIERPYCERLGTPFSTDLGRGAISPQAYADPPVTERARAVAIFSDGPIRDLVHCLKYGDRLDLAPALSRWMARAGAELLAEADLLVPVPLHRGRLWSRRFNQAALLAHGLSRICGVPHDPLALARIKPTRQQVGMTRAQRADNLQGAFRAGCERGLAGKRIVLVDDVLTTGATINAAARALLRAGAARVDALVLARVVADGGNPI